MQQIKKEAAFDFGGIPAKVFCTFDAKTALDASIEIEMQFSGGLIPNEAKHFWDGYTGEADRGFRVRPLADELRDQYERKTKGEGYDSNGDGTGTIRAYVSIGDACFQAIEYGQKNIYGEWSETDFEITQPDGVEYVLFDDADRWLFETPEGKISLLQAAFAALAK